MFAVRNQFNDLLLDSAYNFQSQYTHHMRKKRNSNEHFDRFFSFSFWLKLIYFIFHFSFFFFSLSRAFFRPRCLCSIDIVDTLMNTPWDGSYIEQDRVCGFWTWLFVLSKLPELGDTLFVVLRKQPLIFLHWYHHITVLIYSWFSYTEYTSSARWFIVMNYCVHSVMYSYYALRAMGYRPPRFIPMVITSLQLTQMIVGCTINLWAYDYLQSVQNNQSTTCHISAINIKLSIAMYFSYFVLFARFFYVTYLSANARKGKHSHKNLSERDDTSRPITVGGSSGKMKDQ